MKEYLRVFSDEKVGAANQKQFKQQDYVDGKRKAVTQHEQEDNIRNLAKHNRPVIKMDYKQLKDSTEDGDATAL
jgi:ribosomal protein S12 methylthiotransferase accessory factor YcaO